ncbi:MAG: hypothetical protein ACKPEA_04725 [Planctomycetota bacterium]
MNVRLFVASLACSLTSAAFSQGVGGQLNFGGYYNRTTFSGGAGNASVTSYGYGGGIGLGVSSGYGGGYGSCYGYGAPYGYGGGCAPVYVPYSPFTRTYGNPCYPSAVVVPSTACVVPVYPVACGQFIVR